MSSVWGSGFIRDKRYIPRLLGKVKKCIANETMSLDLITIGVEKAKTLGCFPKEYVHQGK